MSRGLVFLGAVLGISLAVAQGAPAASLPTFVIKGHGWGHGVGMGQDGAYGYAKHGFGYTKILAHYYPGTAMSKTTVQQVRVLLADSARTVSITSRSSFRVRDADGNSYPLAAGTYALGPALKVRVEATAAPKALPGPLRFTPGRLPLELGRAYRGSIQVTAKSGGLQAVDIVGLEDYVRGVISQEVDPEWPMEALKAQAVASRSFAVAERKSGSFDVYADTRSQVYGGVNAEQFSTNAAVQATEGKILTYRGQPALTYFSASSGGRTAAVQDGFPGSKPVPYLVSVDDPYDTVSPYHSWGPLVYGAGDFAKRLGLNGKVQDARASRNPSLRVNFVVFSTSTGPQNLSGGQLRDELGLRSTFFSVGVLALDKPSKPLVYGIGSPLSGIARAISNPRVERLDGGKWVLAATVDRDPDGTFIVPVKATAKASYRVAGSGAASTPVAVGVSAYVKLDPAPSSSSLSGRARPIVEGAPVTIQRNTGSGWTNVASAALDGTGHFSVDLTVQPASYRARYAPRHGVLAGISPILRVVSHARRLAFTPNDPLINKQWYLQQIKAFDYWQQLPPLAPVRVAVIDSGIDGTHPEFQGDQIYLAKSFVSSKARVDTQGHGTFVAGEIAAATNNGIGIAGIGFKVQLLIGKVVRSDGTIPLKAEAKAIRWAVDQGARVINLSLAGLRDLTDSRRDTYSPLEAAAIRYAVSKKVLVVAAVGNSDQAPRSPWNFAGYPAALPHVVGVSALDSTGNVPEFSDRDTQYNDISAPGSDVFSTLPYSMTKPYSVCDLQGYSDCGPFEFRHAEGTSFSAPMVTAAAALVLGMRPTLVSDQVSSILERSALDMNATNGCRACPPGHDRLSGAGRVDVQAALGAVADSDYVRADVREPNDDAGKLASTIWKSPEGTINATTDYWDDPVDVYRIKLTKGRRIWLTLNGPQNASVRLGLWRPGTKTVVDLSPAAQKKRVAQSARSGSVQKINAFQAKTGGWYYVEVQMTSKNAGAYAFQFRRS